MASLSPSQTTGSTGTSISRPILPSSCFSNTTTPTSRYDLLACWLQHLKWDIPNQSFHAGGVFHLELHSLQCSNTTIGGIHSNYYYSTDDDPLLQTTFQNISIQCQGKYHETSLGLTGKITARVGGQNHALDLLWQILTATATTTNNNDTVRRPDSVQTKDCSTELALESLHFEGSTSAHCMDLFHAKIEHAVSSAVQQNLCTKWIPSFVIPTINDKVMRPFSEWIDRFLSNANNNTNATTASDELVVDLTQQVPFLKQSMDWINHNVIQQHLDHGFLLHREESNTSSNVTLVNSMLPPEQQQHQRRQLQQYNNNDNDNDYHDCGYFFDGWNGILDAYFNGRTIPVAANFHYNNKLADLVLQIHNITVMNSYWTKIQLFDIQNVQSIRNWIQTQNVSFVTHMTLQIMVPKTTTAITMSNNDDNKLILIEHFAVELKAHNLSVLMDTMVGLNQTTLSNIRLANSFMMFNRTGWDCFATALEFLQVSELSLQAAIAQASLIPYHQNDTGSDDDNLEHDLDDLINTIVQLVLDEYPPLVTKLILAAGQGPARQALNHALNASIAPENDKQCHHNVSSATSTHFTQTLLKLNKFLGRNDVLKELNSYMDCVAGYIGNSIQKMLQSFLTAESPVNFELQNTGSVRQVQVLSPGVKNHSTGVMETMFEYGRQGRQQQQDDDHADEPRLILEANISLVPVRNLTGSVSVELALDGLVFSAGSGLLYETGQLEQNNLWQLFQNGAQCLMAPLNLVFYNTSMSLADFGVLLRANMSNHVSLEIDTRNYPTIHSLVSQTLDWVVASEHELAMTESQRTIDDAYFVCHDIKPPPHQDTAQDDDVNYASILLIIGAVILFAQPALLLIQRPPRGRNSGDNDDDDSLLRTSQRRSRYEEQSEPLLAPSSDLARHQTSGDNGSSLMNATSTPYFNSVLVPVLIFATTALLISSNLSVGATVDLVASFGDETTFRSPPLFAFSLFNTASEMLKAKIYPLFLLVVVFSGIWPYVKLLLLFWSWIAPQKYLSIRRRGRLLLALDALGKFSLVDTYVLVLFVVAFRYHLGFATSDLDVFITPQAGFYGFLLATILSLVLGHILVFSHRRAALELSDQVTPNEPLLEHSFHVEGVRKQLSRKFQLLLFVTFILTTALLGIGITRPSFVFEFGGLAGALIGDDSHSAYSLLSLGTSISGSMEHSASVGVLFLEGTFYFFAVIMPGVCLVSLGLLLIVPMNIKRQLVLLTIAEIANAWSAIEVFVLSVVAALFEISTFASFILGDKCNLVDQILVDYPDVFGKNPTCYTVTSDVSPDGIFLILGVVLNSACVSLVLRLVHLSIDERIRDLGQVDEDQLALEDRGSTCTIVEQLGAFPVTRWILAPSINISFQLPQAEDSDNNGPPVYAGGDKDRVADTHPSLPWQSPQNRDRFEDDWKESADKDPSWKEWKDTTNVT